MSRMNWDRVRWEDKGSHPDETLHPPFVPHFLGKEPPKSFPARFPTRCHNCHGRVAVGELITKAKSGRYVHAKGCRPKGGKARDQGGPLRDPR